jgi:5-methylthioadenosine/S-adenosylhomocysteine deaminase
MTGVDEFDDARPGRFAREYGRGVLAELPPPPDAELFGLDATGRVRHRPTAMADVPAGSYALHGAVITGTEAMSSGYLVINDGIIAAVQATEPIGVDRIVETDGVILPGLIDLHGHPEFNVFAAWEPPKLFANRYRWRSSEVYHQLVRDPQDLLLAKVPAGTELRYAEIRALAGGVTAIQGAGGAARKAGSEPLVRNVDLWIFGQHKARAMIDLPSSTSGRDFPRLQNIIAEIGTGEITAFYLHLCEGQRGDDRSNKEFQRFLEMGAATPATVLIHASSLDAAQIHQVADAGCKLVWSPQSNLRLYAQTTLAAEAIAAGMPVGLGADWLPSGSTSLLAEMKVARRELARQGLQIEPADLVRMVTSGAASIAGLGDHLGELTVGRPADVLVLERHHADPYENVCLADPSWVEMVLIGGDITYGRADWYQRLAAEPDSGEALIAWGKPMRLDCSFSAPPGQPLSTLADVRSALTAAYPPVGPIYA